MVWAETVLLSSAELYDPVQRLGPDRQSITGRYNAKAVLLPNGKVLVAGGLIGYTEQASCELYDPATGLWTATGSLATRRWGHTMSVLTNGEVLVAGGITNSNTYLASVEIYDPAQGTWRSAPSLETARFGNTSTVLPDGHLLLASGSNDSGFLQSAELYDLGLGFSSDWQPEIESARAKLKSGSSLVLTGSRFQGISQASGGNTQDSSGNYPVVQLRRIDSNQVVFLQSNSSNLWSDTSFTSVPVSDFPFGPALVTIFTNGIPSDARYLVVAPGNE